MSSDIEIDWDQTPKGNIESGVCRLLLNGWVDIFNIKDEYNTNLKFMVLMDGIDKAEWKCSALTFLINSQSITYQVEH